MGCCVSTNKASYGENEVHLEVGLESFNQKPILESRAPPPSAEEETVKEVLSETPKPKAPIFIPQEEKNKTQMETPVFVKIHGKESLNFNIKPKLKSPVNFIEDSASEDVSEICSVSLSESISTITDRRDDEEEVTKPQRVFRSPARSGSRNQAVGRSPTRKLEQSPGRRNGVVCGGSSVRLVQSREPTVRRGSKPDPPRKDPGESSRRRSRSPAVNRSVMGRSPSGRKTNQSPGRARDPGESGQTKKVELLLLLLLQPPWQGNGQVAIITEPHQVLQINHLKTLLFPLNVSSFSRDEEMYLKMFNSLALFLFKKVCEY